ncbi:MAG: hypothetical protein ACPGKS_00930 [Coraliomargarita sp.]
MMKWILIPIGLLLFSGAARDLYTGESTLSYRRSDRTVTRNPDGRVYYGFVAIKAFMGSCLIYGAYRLNNEDDTWY